MSAKKTKMNTLDILPFITKLLDGAEVEWKPLGEVCEKVASINWAEQSTQKVYRYIDLSSVDRGTHRIVESSYITAENAPSRAKQIVLENDVLFGSTRPMLKRYTILDTSFTGSIASTGFTVLRANSERVLPRWIFYLIASKPFYVYIEDKQHGASYPSISDKMVKSFPIPIPPLVVQEKIVDILDRMTQYSAELAAELEGRKKQYQYYRDTLLSFGPEVVRRPLGALGQLVRGNGLQKSDFTTTGVPAIHYGQIYTKYGLSADKTFSFVSEATAQKLRHVYKGDVIITNTSENVSDVATTLVYEGSVPAVTGGHATILRPQKNLLLGRFFAYYSRTSMFAIEKEKHVKGAKVIDVSAKDLAKIQIPIPPLVVQEKIVDILDRFDTLCNSISEGLPRELELRQKQYEYYRDRLLTFAEPCSSPSRSS